MTRPDGSPELRPQYLADDFNAELDGLDDAQAAALEIDMRACGCTLLCYWTEERMRHFREHIANVRSRMEP